MSHLIPGAYRTPFVKLPCEAIAGQTGAAKIRSPTASLQWRAIENWAEYQDKQRDNYQPAPDPMNVGRPNVRAGSRPTITRAETAALAQT